MMMMMVMMIGYNYCGFLDGTGDSLDEMGY